MAILNRIVPFSGAAIVALFCSGCVDAALMNKVNRLESSVSDLRGFQAEQTTQIEAMQAEVRTLSGKLEEMEYAQNQRLGGALNDIKRDLSTLQQRVPPPTIVPAAALEADEIAAGRMPSEIGTRLGGGLLKLRQGKFDDALPLLQEGLGMSYGNQNSVLFSFWIGVAYDGLNDSKQALAAYNEVTSRAPKHPRAPLALLRQASVLVRLGDTKTAKLMFQKLAAEHPKSAEGLQAKERLKDF